MAEIGTAYIDVVPRFDPNIARIQILELPLVVNGDATGTPFAVIIDGASQDSPLRSQGEYIRRSLGAVSVIFTDERVAV